jgi:hypothetical protein
MKKLIKDIFLILLLLNFTSCAKRNFYPDTDDPGLSRFTSYGFNVATEYINSVPYINPFNSVRGNYLPTLTKISTSGVFDTLSLSWQIVMNDATQTFNSDYSGICLLIPVSKTFDQNDFLAWNGQRVDSNTAAIQTNSFYQPGLFSGTANIFFVKISVDSSQIPKKYILSGLFNGNILNSAIITDGRFDFEFYANDFNF